jgi:hypothetical protein
MLGKLVVVIDVSWRHILPVSKGRAAQEEVLKVLDHCGGTEMLLQKAA